MADRELAQAMADLLHEDEADLEARVVSVHELLHDLRETDRERILDRLNSRTVEDIESSLALRHAADARLAAYERRSGWDRRSGRDRRAPSPATIGTERGSGGERRSGRDRRSGHDRRRGQQPRRSGVR